MKAFLERFAKAVQIATEKHLVVIDTCGLGPDAAVQEVLEKYRAELENTPGCKVQASDTARLNWLENCGGLEWDGYTRWFGVNGNASYNGPLVSFRDDIDKNMAIAKDKGNSDGT